MVYSDKLGRRIYRPPRRRPPQAVKLNDTTTRYILEVAAKHPKSTPAEAYVAIHYGQRRDDITKAMVRYALWRN
jgi:hypothetical protein